MAIKEKASDGLSVEDIDSDQSITNPDVNPCTDESDTSLGGLARINEVQLSTESEKPELTKLTISDITKTESKRYDTNRRCN